MTELLLFRESGGSVMFRFEQHPLPAGMTFGEHVGSLLATFRNKVEAEANWVMTRETAGLRIDTWAVYPDPNPGISAVALDGLPGASTGVVEEIFSAAATAAQHMSQLLREAPETVRLQPEDPLGIALINFHD